MRSVFTEVHQRCFFTQRAQNCCFSGALGENHKSWCPAAREDRSENACLHRLCSPNLLTQRGTDVYSGFHTSQRKSRGFLNRFSRAPETILCPWKLQGYRRHRFYFMSLLLHALGTDQEFGQGKPDLEHNENENENWTCKAPTPNIVPPNHPLKIGHIVGKGMILKHTCLGSRTQPYPAFKTCHFKTEQPCLSRGGHQLPAEPGSGQGGLPAVRLPDRPVEVVGVQGRHEARGLHQGLVETQVSVWVCVCVSEE